MRQRLGPNLVELTDAVGNEVREIRELLNGDLSTLNNLNTLEKANLVAAINEVLGLAKTSASLEDVDVVVQDYFVLHPQTFTFEQSEPILSWLITHPLDHRPAVTIIDSAGTIWRGQVSYPAVNQVRVQFNLALAGKAVLT